VRPFEISTLPADLRAGSLGLRVASRLSSSGSSVSHGSSRP
jgi:hypothetical protein